MKPSIVYRIISRRLFLSELLSILKTGELHDGAMKHVKAGGKDIMVSRVSGKYYAIDNHCGHMGGDLSAGKLEGAIVTCPRHGSQWDVTDGHNVRWLRTPGTAPKVSKIGAYPVKIDGDNILVQI